LNEIGCVLALLNGVDVIGIRKGNLAAQKRGPGNSGGKA
jgi:hypothetical protein